MRYLECAYTYLWMKSDLAAAVKIFMEIGTFKEAGGRPAWDTVGRHWAVCDTESRDAA
ncbi:hypothetical protein [Acetatifactor aquisgranensis]|uniref:hypothetical protein n=1 Tax=Acetatifactor aquisgranensis TaxID=2941233 RepID=UPI00203B8E9A|nr:hypothetical protein [Acetatifactor aquisgranensis]